MFQPANVPTAMTSLVTAPVLQMSSATSATDVPQEPLATTLSSDVNPATVTGREPSTVLPPVTWLTGNVHVCPTMTRGSVQDVGSGIMGTRHVGSVIAWFVARHRRSVIETLGNVCVR